MSRGLVVLALVILSGLGAANPAVAADGDLTQLAGTAGCINRTGDYGCATNDWVSGHNHVISPDGKNVYTTSFDSLPAITVFDRDLATGALTAKAGTDGCVTQDGSGGACGISSPMIKPSGIVVSPDGKHVYVADFDQHQVTIFDRNPTTGTLTRRAGLEGCWHRYGWNGCRDGSEMTYAAAMAISADGTSIYLLAAQSVTLLQRNTTTGELSQPAGTASCISDDGSGGACVDGRAMTTVESIAISPDDKHVYVRSRSRALLVFDRNPTTGVLTQKVGGAGCWVSSVTTDCQVGVGLDGGGVTRGLAVSPDGKSVYVPSGDALAIFDRDTTSGVLTQKPGLASCVSATGSGGTCTPGLGMSNPTDVKVSPDGKHVYASTAGVGGGIAIFDRNTNSGELTQKLEPDGCISDTGTGGDCRTGRGLPSFSITISPDGRHVYAGGLAIFDRAVPVPAQPPVSTSPTPGIGPQQSTPATQALADSNPPSITARFLGRPQASAGYPWTGVLMLTNTGKRDSISPVVRIDGFHTGAKVEAVGAISWAQDTGAERAVFISIPRVAARSTRSVLVRFVPVGPGHSFYHLRPLVIQHTSTRRGMDYTFSGTTASRTVRAATKSGETGVITITNSAGTANINYTIEELSTRPSPDVGVSVRNGRMTITMRLPIAPEGTKPPLARDLRLPIPGENRVMQQASIRYELAMKAQAVLRADNEAATVSKLQDEIRDAQAKCLTERGKLVKKGFEMIREIHEEHLRQLNAPQLLQRQAIFERSSLVPGLSNSEFNVLVDYSTARTLQYIEDQMLKGVAPPGTSRAERAAIAIAECHKSPNPTPTTSKDLELSVPNEFDLEVITPDDPNDKVGPRGGGAGHHIRPNRTMPYTILFENKPTAGAPAREVIITDQIDASTLKLDTFALGPMWFGEHVLTPPPGLRAWSGMIDLRPAKAVRVTVDARIDDTGLATWHFKTVDVSTGTFPEDPALGFLPANTTKPLGEGGVSFTISQARNLAHGKRIRNGARIVFDKNAPIDTPIYTNTIDRRAPAIARRSIRAVASIKGRRCTVRLAWRGTDRGSGIRSSFLVASTGRRGRFFVQRTDLRGQRYVHRGVPGRVYRFRIRPVDRAGNVGALTRTIVVTCPRAAM